MRLRAELRDFPLFERPAEVWRAMGAPSFMWDDVEALRVARLVTREGFRLDGPEFDSFRGQAERHVVRRFRREVARWVLRQRGALTERERNRIERWPSSIERRVAPKSWVEGVSVAEIAAGRVPR
ncbi:hypothetical protein [Actinomadura rudentiformis]|uniref:Uncharacterized protein n=1 Tax=Actinomadura rudentiformis TaxID=359158 RepID=A0A6H9YMZ7_9ACTN|nr:hypothetical protein [Actinomadura rudentiformis]KAB2341876.1 hypothetical protein F8566_40575 [Actinomadura rudentiformis]